MFKKVILYTDQLQELKGFYEFQFGFRVVEADENSFVLTIGDSELEFRASDRASFYHFAFNIPGNQFSLAKAWAEARVSLNRESGEDEIYYRNFDADAFYFEDPAGNVIEFIGRRSVDRLGNFTIDSLLNVSEISITTPHMEEVGDALQKNGISVWGSRDVDPAALNFLGKGDTFILLVPPKRTWYFSKTKSETHPLSIELIDGRRIDVSEEGQVRFRKASNPINEKLEELQFSGVILWRGKDVWTAAKGFSNRAEELPNAVDTRFSIASGSKIFTAVAVCQLIEQGKLSLEDKLSELLPKTFPDFDVTVHQLLTHTSGIPDYFDETEMQDYEQLWQDRPMYRMESDSDFVALFHTKPMMAEPGERFYYNNAGYIALGLIVKKLRGRSLADVVQKEVFDRAEMTRSGYFWLDRLPKHTAIGYIEKSGAWRANQYAVPIRGGADGGAFVTAEDMNLFWERLLDYTLLSEEMTQKLLTPHAKTDKGAYGYGVWIASDKYSVTGYNPGVSFQSCYYPADGATLTVLSNKSVGAYEVMELLERKMTSDR